MTEIVSCTLLATKIRLPSGEATMLYGSAPVISVFWTAAVMLLALLAVTLITVTLLSAALAT